MLGDIDYSFFHKAVQWGWEGLIFFNKLFEVHGLIAELPEMMFRVVLIPVGEELKKAQEPFFAGLRGMLGNSPQDLFS